MRDQAEIELLIVISLCGRQQPVSTEQLVDWLVFGDFTEDKARATIRRAQREGKIKFVPTWGWYRV